MQPTLRSSSLSSRKLAGAALAACLTLAGIGCAPEGSPGNRIDPYETTQSDRKSGKANLPSLLEFGDKAAEQLVRDLGEIEFPDKDERVILELGTIVNKTHTPTQDFEQLQVRMRNRIRQSKVIRDQFKIVESIDRQNAELHRVGAGGGSQDLLQEGGGGGSGRDLYDPRKTYVLQGDFYESRRGDRSQFYLNFQLSNVQSGEIVYNHDFDLGQVKEK
jgi:hypothetical protein